MRNPRASVVCTALATVLAVGTLPAACNRRPATTTSPLACRVNDEFRRFAARTPWPGFAPRTMPLAIFDGTSTWMFRFPTALSGFATAPECAGAQRFDGQHPNVRANTSIEWDSVQVATMIIRDTPAESIATLAATAIHEAFHVHQRVNHPTWAANEAALFFYPATDESLLALARMEMEALRHSIAAEDDRESARWAATAVATRAARGARMPPETLAYERATELNEGLAQYVERRTLEAGTRAEHGSRAQLSDDFPADGVRWRCYASGEAWALALDRHVRSWRQQLAARDTVPLDVWLQQDPEVQRATAHEFDAATRARCETAARHAVASLREARVEEGRRFLASAGHTLVFETANAVWWPQFFDPLNVRLLNDGVVLHRRWLEVSNETDRIEIQNRAVLTEPAGPHPLMHGVRRLVIAGLDAPPALVGSDSTLVVRATGVEATLRNATASTSGNATIVSIAR